MTKSKHSKESSFMKVISNEREVAGIFLGVGLVLFFLNISGLLSNLRIVYNHISFDISVFSAMLVILFSVYILYEKNNK